MSIHSLDQLVRLIAVPIVACLPAFSGCAPRKAPDPVGREELEKSLSELAVMSVAEDGAFRRKIQAIAHEFETVPVGTELEGLQWTEVELDSRGLGFDAIRFKCPLDRKADVRWAFSTPIQRHAVDPQFNKPVVSNWCIAPVRGRMESHFHHCFKEEDLDVDHVELVDGNQVNFQTSDRGVLEPGAEYVLWFRLEDHYEAEPVRLHVLIRIVTKGQLAEPRSSEHVARDLGIALPFRRKNTRAIAELLSQSQLDYSQRNLVGALQHAERARQLNPKHRRTLLFLTSLNVARGQQLKPQKQKGETEFGDSIDHCVIAANHARRLRQTYPDLSEIEESCCCEALVAGAEAHAMDGRPEDALSALRDAIDAGLKREQLESSRFDALRERAEFRNLLGSAIVGHSQKHNPTSVQQPKHE